MDGDTELQKVAERVRDRSTLSKQTFKKGEEAADLPD